MSADTLLDDARASAGAVGATARAPREDPTWFGSDDRPLFAWVHRPADDTARGAVLLCPPLARERATAHATFRLLAQRLARAGLVAVRFDYDGSGDSAGSDKDPARVEAWLSSIDQAASLARSCGAPSVALVGMRMGALLAAAACSRLEDVAAVVLWDPCVSGRSFVREQRALHATRVTAPRADGAELPGYELTAETLAALSSLELPDLDCLGIPVRVLERPDRPSKMRQAHGWGEHVEVGEALGQDLLLNVLSLVNHIPEQTLDHVVDWLDAHMGHTRVAVSIDLRDMAVVTADATQVIERFVRLGPLQLFGVESASDADPRLPVVLMLNAGNEWHAGPNRLWVDLSRRWARLGFRCVRFDESGLGDSPTRPGSSRHMVRAPAAFDDVADAAEAVSPTDPGNVLLVGLCSGAYQALEHGLRRSVRGICAINPIFHFRPPELANGSLDPRRRICQPTTAAVHAYRRLPLGHLKRLLRGPLWWVTQVRARRRSARSWPEELAAQDVRVLLIGGLDELRPVLELHRTDGSRHSWVGDTFEIEVVPGLDHDLVVASDRTWVSERLTEHLARTFVEDGGRSEPVAR